MYAIRLLEEGGDLGGVGGYVWVALALFFVMVFIGWLASSNGWLTKAEPIAHSDKVNNSHGATGKHT